MDVHCLGCNEPWDTYHIMHDAVWDAICDGHLWPEIAQLDDAEAMREALQKRWPERKLDPYIRAGFQKVGWEFGSSLYVVLHCPCCKPSSKPASSELCERTKLAAEVLGDDLDGLASMIGDE